LLLIGAAVEAVTEAVGSVDETEAVAVRNAGAAHDPLAGALARRARPRVPAAAHKAREGRNQQRSLDPSSGHVFPFRNARRRDARRSRNRTGDPAGPCQEHISRYVVAHPRFRRGSDYASSSSSSAAAFAPAALLAASFAFSAASASSSACGRGSML